MIKRTALAAMFGMFFALPALAHGPDFSDASLVARAPTETMLSAYITAIVGGKGPEMPGSALQEAMYDAWESFGRGIALEKWRFPFASFNGATMVKIKLNDAVLTSASFDRANLQNAELKNSDANRATFRYAEARGLQLAGAHLRGADFTGADLQHGILGGILRVAQGGPVAADCKDPKNPATDFTFADLSGADLRHADLTCAIFRGATMDRLTQLSDAKLDHADFCGAHLKDVDFTGAQSVATANFDWADIRGAKLPVPDLHSLQADYAFVAGTSFTAPRLEAQAPVKVNLQKAHLSSLSREIPDPAADHTSKCGNHSDQQGG